MDPAPMTLTVEVWEEEDGRTQLCLAGPDGSVIRATLGPRARRGWVGEASSPCDAMIQFHEYLGLAPYQPKHDGELTRYTQAQVVRQRRALAAELGRRDVVAGDRVAQAWREAAIDLEIRFESPFAVTHEGTTYWVGGWLPDFGGPRGTIIAGRYSLDAAFDAVDAQGYYFSGLSPYYYGVYDRDRFIETLNDWGWEGAPEDAPSWFTGGFGRHGGSDGDEEDEGKT